ncbi:hypothetical protein WA588_000116 [Blastocystis sp. NMH]
MEGEKPSSDPFDTLEEDVSDVAPVEDDLDFHEGDPAEDDIYVPENAEDVLRYEGIDTTDEWKERFNQYKHALDQMKDQHGVVSKYKRKLWSMKQREIGLKSEINVHKNKIQLLEESVASLSKEKATLQEEKAKREENDTSKESEMVALRSMISKKNRDIIQLEKQLTDITRKLAESTTAEAVAANQSSESVRKSMDSDNNNDTNDNDDSTNDDTEEESPSDEQSDVEKLNDFISVIRAISLCRSSDEAILLLQQTQKRCFHCGRYLASCAQSGGYDCCNYCCILSNLLSETKEPKENTEVRDVFLLLFVVITVVLAILMYYWKDEAIQLVRQAESVLRKLYLLVCYLPMSSFFDSDYRTVVGEKYYARLLQTEIEDVVVPIQSCPSSTEYQYLLKQQQKSVPTSINESFQFQKEVSSRS